MISKILWIQTLPSPWATTRCVSINMETKTKGAGVLVNFGACVFSLLEIHVTFQTVDFSYMLNLESRIHNSFLVKWTIGWMSHVVVVRARWDSSPRTLEPSKRGNDHVTRRSRWNFTKNFRYLQLEGFLKPYSRLFLRVGFPLHNKPYIQLI